MFWLLLRSDYVVWRFDFEGFSPILQAVWGNWEWTQPGQVTPSDQRDIPYHMTSCSASKAGGKKKKRGNVCGNGVCLPKKTLHILRPSFPGKCLNVCLPMASSEEIPCFALLVPIALIHLLDCFYLDPWFFSFCSFNSLPHPTKRWEVSERLRGA